MILSAHQPNYLPGLQLFNKIMLSDAFMHVPHCQFQRRSWHHRNYIDSGLLTVPVTGPYPSAISEVQIDFTKPWQRKHIRAIEIAYGNEPFFDDYFPDIRWAIDCAYDHRDLYSLNRHLMNYLTSWLGCDRFDKITYSSESANAIRSIKDPVDMIIKMCQLVGADTYLSNGGASAYIGPEEEKRMADAGITHKWQMFDHPDYGQSKDINGGMLSVIDLLFAKGPEAHDIVHNAGTIAT